MLSKPLWPKGELCPELHSTQNNCTIEARWNRLRYSKEIPSEKIRCQQWDLNPWPSNPSLLASLSSLLPVPSRPSLSTVVGPYLVAIDLKGTTCWERPPAFKFWHEPELPRACSSKGFSDQLRNSPALPRLRSLWIFVRLVRHRWKTSYHFQRLERKKRKKKKRFAGKVEKINFKGRFRKKAPKNPKQNKLCFFEKKFLIVFFSVGPWPWLVHLLRDCSDLRHECWRILMRGS